MKFLVLYARNVFAVLTSLVFIALSIGCAFYIFFYPFIVQRSGSLETSFRQIATFDPSSNETHLGVIKQGNEDFFPKSAIFGSEGKLHLISKFGEDEYECTGTCFCEEKLKRRSSLPLTRGIVYLVAALSSALAFEQARNYFDEECVNSFNNDEDTCDSIRSEVEECALLFAKRKNNAKTQQKSGQKPVSQSKKKKKHEKGGREKYVCIGTCMGRYVDRKTQINELSYIDKIRILWKVITKSRHCYRLTMKGIERGRSEEDAAKKFLDKQLHSFCTQHEISLVRFKRKDGTYFEFSLCWAYSLIREKKKKASHGPLERNRSVVCRKYEVEPLT